MKYTQHNLTENQLRFLSQIVNKRQRNGFQPTVDVLMRHGLIVVDEARRSLTWLHHDATSAGRLALAQARAEGW
jgi:hypothetical protein